MAARSGSAFSVKESRSSKLAETILSNSPADIEALAETVTTDGATVEETRQNLIQKIGENITIRRFQILEAGEGEVVGATGAGETVGVAAVSTIVKVTATGVPASPLAPHAEYGVAVTVCWPTPRLPQSLKSAPPFPQNAQTAAPSV